MTENSERTRRIGIIVNGATGGVTNTKHLSHVLVPIIREGGLKLANGDRIVPDLLLLARDDAKLKEVADKYGLTNWTTDLEGALANKDYPLYFDAANTGGRLDRVRRAFDTGKHVYTEKPLAQTVHDAEKLVTAARKSQLKNGVVVDKIYLPGLKKLQQVLEAGTLGPLLAVKIDFGWWVFDGQDRPSQRASWNYQKVNGGGLLLDMFPHWVSIIHHLFGDIAEICCQANTLIPERWDEDGKNFRVDVEDSVNAFMTLADGTPVQLSTSWATRVYRKDLMTIQVDGRRGSAVATLHECFTQSLEDTPKPYFDPENRQSMKFEKQWQAVKDTTPFVHSFRTGWEEFLSHVVQDTPFKFDFEAGLKMMRVIDTAYKSVTDRRWEKVPH
ncbi:MAG: Gfo/Idh/MocA family protein [Methyloligellaceae bacterium]